MPFPFTFSLSVPGISNPFATAVQPELFPRQVHTSQVETAIHHPNVRHERPAPRRRPSPVPSISPLPLSKKRGWEPSLAEPSHSATYYTSTSGYLDTPAKYRDMALSDDHNRSKEQLDREIEDMAAELPPTKRRRTIAGSIASTALSAALIGTAVGLTVYRLLRRWRDRGKEEEAGASSSLAPPHTMPPPPPAYEQGEWVPQAQAPSTTVSPPTPRKRIMRNTPTGKRTTITRHRRTRTTPNAVAGPSSIISAPSRPEFDFGHAAAEEEQDDPEDQMDWIGDKLSQLIAEGQKALGREIVVASEVQEDQVDDGTDAWVEEFANGNYSSRSLKRSHSRDHSPSRTGSTRRARPPPLSHMPSRELLRTGSESPRANRFLPNTPQNYGSITIPGRGRAATESVIQTPNSSFRDDESQWQSPEIRESMARARARLFANRG